MPTHLFAHSSFAKHIHSSVHDAGFFYGGPTTMFIPMVWGMPMILDNHLEDPTATGKDFGLMLDLGPRRRIFLLERGGLVFEWAAPAGDEFKQYQRLRRAGQRMALVVIMPQAALKFVTKA